MFIFSAVLSQINILLYCVLVSSLNLDDEMDYDDEVDGNGNIDIGEIAAQYLALELY